MTEKAAVVGLGYVGIPLACCLAQSGARVVGIDVDDSRLDAISRGKNPLKGEEPGLSELLAEVVGKKMLTVSREYSDIGDADAVFVCVDTPIDKKKEPVYDNLLSAVKRVGEHMKRGALISIESTIAPATMKTKILKILEKESGLKAGSGFYLAHCPERVMPGKLLYNIINLDRIIGGFDEKSADVAERWYARFVKGKLYKTDMTTAEVVKTVENAYRDVQIAFANEVGLICETLGLDAFEVRRLVNTSPFRDMHLPGAGVGGHCLPKDPWLLVYGGRKSHPSLMPTARAINDRMPVHVVELVSEAFREAKLKMGKDKVVTVLGYSFLENSGDTRNSPAKTVVTLLSDKVTLRIHDPYVLDTEGLGITKDLEAALKGSDCAVLVTKHRAYSEFGLNRMAQLMRHKILVDGRNAFDKSDALKQGFVYRGVGKG
ncbi:MAG: nucleotide sugar dehydrogenase [Thermoplasmata archaeon]